jgi:hypothetical protein
VVHQEHPDSRLFLVGIGIARELFGATRHGRAWNNVLVYEDDARGISVWETVSPFSDKELAAIYRGVDFTVSTSRSEGFGFTVAESMACGTPAIFGDYGGTKDFVFPGALTFEGRPTRADYSDKGFADVGSWWEPDFDGLLKQLRTAMQMDGATYEQLSEKGVRVIRGAFTWRNTVFRLRTALEAVQTQELSIVSANADQAQVDGRGPKRSWLARKAIFNLRRFAHLALMFAEHYEHYGFASATKASVRRLAHFATTRAARYGRKVLAATRRVVPHFIASYGKTSPNQGLPVPANGKPPLA